MTHDRDYYRSLSALNLLRQAREEGITPEMAVAIAEELAARLNRDMRNHFHFRKETECTK